MKMPTPKVLFVSSAIGLISMSASSNAQTVLIDPTTLNGSFETLALGPGGKDTKGFDATPAPNVDILNWGNTNTNWLGDAAFYNDTGAEYRAPSQEGVQFSFYHGGEGGAFNLTSYAIHEGDSFSLTWYGYQDTVGIRLFSSTTGDYSSAATLNEIDIAQPGGTWVQYSLAYTAVAADEGKTIGVSIFNSGVGYANVDDVVLTVTPVPEPTTCVLGALGLTFCLLFRSRLRKTAA